MDSIKTKIVNATQTSGHDIIDFASGTWSATSYYRPIYIPMGARVSDVVVVLHDTIGSGTGTNTFEVGYFGGTVQETAWTNHVASGAADPNAFMTAVDLEGAQTTYSARGSLVTSTDNTGASQSTYAGVALMGMPPTTTAATSYAKSGTSGDTFQLSTAGEKVVPVIGKLTLGATQTVGKLVWWVEYRFDANIVWEQASL